MPNVPVLNSATPLDLNHPLNQGLISEWSTLAQPHGRTGHPSRLLLDLATGKGSLYHGSINSATVWTGAQTRRSGWASLSMTANTNDGVDCGARVGPAGGFTFAVWVRPTNVDVTGLIASQFQASGACYFQLFLSFGATITARILQSDSIWIGRSVPGLMLNNVWQHVAMTWDGTAAASGIKSFRNGVRIDTTNDTGGSFSAAGTGASTIRLGYQGSAGKEPYTGLMGDASYYRRPLSPGEIAALYLESLAGNPNRCNWLKSAWKGTAPPSPITGDAALTQGIFTLTATGTVAVAGTSALTQVAQSLAAAGAVSVAGAAPLTQAANTTAGAGAVAVAGAASQTQGADTLASTGAVAIAGAAAVTQAANTLASAGTLTITGGAALTQAGDATSGAGAVSIVGGAGITEAGQTLASAGTVAIAGAAALVQAGQLVVAAGSSTATSILRRFHCNGRGEPSFLADGYRTGFRAPGRATPNRFQCNEAAR